MQQQPQDPLVDSVLDSRYRILNKVARGGMATVYRALDMRLERHVAVKVLHPHLSPDAGFLERFNQEAKAAARLSHPNVVGVFDHGETHEHGQQNAYIVMEYVPGYTLRDVLTAEGSLSPAVALGYTQELLSGLAAAHRAGLVHRDIKPENVLIGHAGQVKVADFGLSRAVTNSTNTATLIGTVAYISPELVLGRPADARSDIYAVGIMLFEMLTGALPFKGDTPIQVAYQHVNSSVPLPSTITPSLDDDLDDLVRWCTESDPEQRPVDGTALLGELEHIQQNLHLPQKAHTELPPPQAEEASAQAPPLPGSAPTSSTVVIPDSEATVALDPPYPFDVDAQETVALPDSPTQDTQATTVLPSSYPSAEPPYDSTETQATTVLPPSYTDVDAPAMETTNIAQTTAFSPRELKKAQKASAKVSAKQAATPTVALKRGNSRRRGAIWLVVILVLALVGALSGWFFGWGPGALATVPDVSSQNSIQASQTLRDSGFSPTLRKVENETIPADQAIGTEPPAFSEQRKFLGVTLIISEGPPTITVPSVIGKPQAEASSILRSAGFKVKLAPGEVFDNKIPKGAVVQQTPAQQTLPRGTQIVLSISRGPKLVNAPDTFGQDEAEAVQRLQDLGFGVKVKYAYGKPLLGKVISQDKSGSLTEDTTITITVM